MIRSVVSVLIGLFVGGTTVALIEAFGHWMYPPPADASDSIEAARTAAPPGALVPVLIAWLAGAFVGSAITAWIANRRQIVHGLVIGGIYVAIVVSQIVALSLPVWMSVLGLIGVPLASWLGAWSTNQPLPGQHEGWIPKPVPFMKSKEQ